MPAVLLVRQRRCRQFEIDHLKGAPKPPSAPFKLTHLNIKTVFQARKPSEACIYGRPTGTES